MAEEKTQCLFCKRATWDTFTSLKLQGALGMPSKKKSSYERKSSFLGGEGVRKKSQISLVKEQKK